MTFRNGNSNKHPNFSELYTNILISRAKDHRRYLANEPYIKVYIKFVWEMLNQA